MAPSTDPRDERTGWGNGDSPLATGTDALDVQPRDQIDVITDPDFSRRGRRTNLQAIGLSGENAEQHTETPTAAVDAATYPDPSPGPARSPNDDYGITPPDDAASATPQIRT